MYTYEEIKCKVKQLLDEKRFEHSVNVEEEAVILGDKYNVDKNRCKIAAIAHDCAKKMSEEELIERAKEYNIKIDEIQLRSPQLLHGPVAAMYLKREFMIDDEDILNAVYYHTTGRQNMSLLEKIIYLADMIEVGRDFPGVDDIRKASSYNINHALILSCNSTLSYVLEKGYLIHPLTVDCRNGLLMESMEK